MARTRSILVVAIILIGFCSISCTKAISASGAKLTATGESTASLMSGKLVLKTDPETGELQPVSCEPWIDKKGVERPCEHIHVKGGAFSGWEIGMSIIGVIANVWSAAK